MSNIISAFILLYNIYIILEKDIDFSCCVLVPVSMQSEYGVWCEFPLVCSVVKSKMMPGLVGKQGKGSVGLISHCWELCGPVRPGQASESAGLGRQWRVSQSAAPAEQLKLSELLGGGGTSGWLTALLSHCQPSPPSPPDQRPGPHWGGDRRVLQIDLRIAKWRSGSCLYECHTFPLCWERWAELTDLKTFSRQIFPHQFLAFIIISESTHPVLFQIWFDKKTESDVTSVH